MVYFWIHHLNYCLANKLKYQKIVSLISSKSSFSFDVNFEKQCYLSLVGQNNAIRELHMITKNYDNETRMDAIFKNKDNTMHDININGNTITANNLSTYDLEFYFTIIYV